MIPIEPANATKIVRAFFVHRLLKDSAIEVTVEHVELLGSETHLYFTADGLDQRLVASVSPRSVAAPGDRITLGFDTNRLHFFDADTEKTILMRL